MLRATVVWLGILVLASINGAGRDLLLALRVGDTPARAISTIVLCGLVVLVTWYTIGWIRPATPRGALTVGLWWVGLTLAFELLAGHYLFHKSWTTLLGDYDVTRGRIWVAVLVTTLLAPLLAARARGWFAA